MHHGGGRDFNTLGCVGESRALQLKPNIILLPLKRTNAILWVVVGGMMDGWMDMSLGREDGSCCVCLWNVVIYDPGVISSVYDK